MNKKYTIFFLVLTIAITLFVHFRWFNSLAILTSGDWGYYFKTPLSELFAIPYVWLRNGLGAPNISLSIYPTQVIMGWLSVHGVSWPVIERLVFMLPAVVISAVASFLLTRKVTKSNIAGLVGACVFSFNIYTLIITQAVLTILVADALVPLALYLLIETLERRTFYLAILTGFVLFIQSFYEFRILYITCFLLVFYVIFYILFIQEDKSRKSILFVILLSIIPFVVVGITNFYWVLPLAKSGSITSNAIFNRGLFGNQYLTITDALLLSVPWWTGGAPSSFIIETLPLYFWILPIAAFTGLFLQRKNKLVIFFGILALLGVFLTKQVDQPLPTVYTFLFLHLPGFNAFREASKFFVISMTGYSVLIGACIAWLFSYCTKTNIQIAVKYAGLGIILLALLYNTKPVISGSFENLYVPRTVPTDYLVLQHFISKQPTFFRTLWFPQSSRWSYYDNMHPQINTNQEFGTDWLDFNVYQAAYNDQYFDAMNYLQQDPSAASLLTASQVKYLVVPLEDTKNDDDLFNPTDIQFGTRKYILNGLQNISYLHKVNIGTKDLVVYENMRFKPGYIASDTFGNVSFSASSQIPSPNLLSQATANPQNCLAKTTGNICTQQQVQVSPNSQYIFQVSHTGNSAVMIYKNDNTQDIVYQKKFSTTLLTQQTAQIITDADTTTLTVVLYTNDTNASLEGLNLSIVPTVTNMPFITNNANPQISYTDISPVKKDVTITHAAGSFMLTLSEAYDPHWKVLDGNYILPQSSHIKYYDSLNAWYIQPDQVCSKSRMCTKNPDGTETMHLVISYDTQHLLTIGEYVSLIGLFGIVALFILSKYKNK